MTTIRIATPRTASRPLMTVIADKLNGNERRRRSLKAKLHCAMLAGESNRLVKQRIKQRSQNI